MSNVDPEEVNVMVEHYGVTVEKSFEPDDFPVPAIAFEIRSQRDEAVDVRLIDTVPEDIPAEDIGFHPKFGAEHWSVEDETIAFEREFGPGEEYTTVYGLRASDAADAERFLDEPTIEHVHPEPGDTDEVVRDVIGDVDGEETGEPTDSSMVEGQDESDQSLDLTEPIESAQPGGDETVAGSGGGASPDDMEAAVAAAENSEAEGISTGTEAEAGTEVEAAIVEADSAGGTPAADGDVAAQLATQIREERIDGDDLQALRDALGVEAPGSTQARVSRLQQDVSDLRAYTDALEEFLDENGEAQTLLRDLREEIDRLEGRVSEVDGNAETATDRAEAAADRVEDELPSIEADLEDVTAEVSALDDRLDSDIDSIEVGLSEMESSVEELRERVESVDEDLDAELSTLREDLTAARSEADEAVNRVAAIEDQVGDVTDLEARMADIEDDLAGLKTVEDRMAEVEDRLEDAQEDIEQFAQMQEQLTSVFGADAGDDADDGGDD